MATFALKGFTLRDGSRVCVRSAEPGDIERIIALRLELSRTHRFGLTQPGDALGGRENLTDLCARLRDGETGLWLLAFEGAHDEGELIGSVNFRPGERQRMAHQGELGIGNHSSWRGRGLGTLLMVLTLNWAAQTPSVEKVCLGVFSGNTGARRLYRRLGFRSEGRVRRQFKLAPGDYEDDIRMGIFVKEGVAPEGYATWRVREA